MRSSRITGILTAVAFLAVCFLLPENGGAPPQAIGSLNMCVQSGCHTSFALNARTDLLTVTGFPETYKPGVSYDITVSVRNNPNTSASAARAGFAAFVNRDGTPNTPSVGTLFLTDPGTWLRSAPTAGGTIMYVTHIQPRAGSPAASFTFRWTAPATPAGDTVLVVASNSANGNGSNTLDLISKQTLRAQAGALCTYSITPTSQSFAAGGGRGSIAVTTTGECSWTASSGAGFISISSATSGIGSGTVTFVIAANPNTSPRTGNITIQGQIFTVMQAASQPENEKLFFSQFGDGDLGAGRGISSTLIVMNRSASQTTSGTVRLFDSNGNPLSVDINGTVVNGVLHFDIPAQGIRFFATDGLGPLVVGSVQLTATTPVGGIILFSSNAGTTGVGAAQPLGKFMVPVESDTTRGVATGIALSNPTTSQIDAILILRDSDGMAVGNGSVAISLPPNGQFSRFPEEIYEGRGIELSKFHGTLEVTAGAPISGMAIRLSPGQFTTFPVAAID